jgi:hypothetical protein
VLMHFDTPVVDYSSCVGGNNDFFFFVFLVLVLLCWSLMLTWKRLFTGGSLL